jgi:hypothetical protein
MFGVEPGYGEPETAVDGVGNQFIAFLLNIQYNCLISRSIFHGFFAFFSPLHYFIDQLRQETPFLPCTLLSSRWFDLHLLVFLLFLHWFVEFFIFLLFLLLIGLFGFVVVGERHERSFDYAEADVVLSDDRGVEGVEIEQQNVVFVEPFHGIDHVPSLVLLPVDFLVLVRMSLLSELIWDNQILFEALMHDEELISFSPLNFQ